MKRRTLLAMLAAAPLRGQRTTAELTILPEELGPISPRIYGHFTEHIGRLIYEGIWVGANSAISRIATAIAWTRSPRWNASVRRYFAGPADVSRTRISGKTASVRARSGPSGTITGGCARSRIRLAPMSSCSGASSYAPSLIFP